MAGISGALPGLVQGLSPAGLEMAAQAIMTTDAFPKISSREGGVGGHPYRILGIAKGAGMIMPNMATMLAFLLTDLRIEVDPLNQIIRTAAEATFNRITVDGDTSTNDTVMVMANSRAGNGALNQKELKDVAHGFQAVMGELAEMMVRDGEGASKVVHVAVRGGHRAADALEGARTVANSTLVKTAFYGQDPNWGRIMAALGRADIHMDPEAVDIWIDDVLIVTNGLGTGAEAERAAAQRMARSAFTLTIDLHQGPYADQMVTCDLTHDYIKINADYRT
jgi:glutamate N-acetyltransferase/amino-acid N-acetyltransferase